MTSKRLPPTSEIQRVAELLQELIDTLISESSKIKNFGHYASDREARDLLKLLIRNVESILCLALSDLLLLPSAAVIARTALETTANLLWLMDSDVPLDRENRLIASLQKDLDVRKKYINNLNSLSITGSEVESIENDKQEIEKYRDAIKAKISSGYREIKKPFTTEQLLQQLELKHLYPAYRALSNFTHGSHAATWLYKRQMPQDSDFGEVIYFKDWYDPLFVCYWALATTGHNFLQRFRGDSEGFCSISFRSKLELILNELR